MGNCVEGGNRPAAAPIVVLADTLKVSELGIPNVLDLSSLKGEDKINNIVEANPHLLIVRSETKVRAELMARLPHVRVIIRAGHGTDNIDCEAAARRKIQVVRTGGSEEAVTALNLRMIASALQGNQKFEVDEAPDSFFPFAEWKAALDKKTKPEMPAGDRALLQQKGEKLLRAIGARTIELLKGKNIGIIGFGSIGQHLAATAKSLGMEVEVSGPRLLANPAKAVAAGYVVAGLNQICRHCQFIVLLTGLQESGPKSNVGMIGKQEIELLAQNPNFMALVNTDRPALVDEIAMARFLETHRDASYMMDDIPGNASLKSHILFTPHIGASTARGEHSVVRATAQALAPLYARISSELNFKKRAA